MLAEDVIRDQIPVPPKPPERETIDGYTPDANENRHRILYHAALDHVAEVLNAAMALSGVTQDPITTADEVFDALRMHNRRSPAR